MNTPTARALVSSFGEIMSVVVLAAALLLPAQAAELVSSLGADADPPASGNADSTAPLLSGDGRWLLFASHATDLVTNDSHGSVLNVFVYSLTNGTTALVSVTLDGRASGNGLSLPGGISSNGQFIVFESRASDLVPGDANGAADVLLRDLLAGATALVSVNRIGTGAGNGASTSPIMTPDGRFVAFESAASDLVENDTNGLADVFVRDLQSGTTTLVSISSNGVSSASGASTRPAISGDGQIVAFLSSAPDLAPSSNGVTSELCIRNLVTGATRKVDPSRPGVSNLAVKVYSHVLSRDGRVIAFVAGSSNTNETTGVRPGLYWCELSVGTCTLVASNLDTAAAAKRPIFSGPGLSVDGQLVAFEARTAATVTARPAVYVWDARTASLELISTNTALQDGVPVPYGLAPVLSAAGNRVAYLAYTAHDPPHPNDTHLQLFVYDRPSGIRKMVSVQSNGDPATDSEFPAACFSDDGELLAFQTRDGNLVVGDANRAFDVFVRDLASDTTHLVSRRSPARESTTGLGSSLAAGPCVSADGRFVVFVSDAPNLSLNDTNGVSDVFVRDFLTGCNLLVSVSADGTGSGNGRSRDPVISVSNCVAFVSSASNLVAGDTNGCDDVFVRDLHTGVTRLVSVNRDHTGSAGGTSSSPSISADDRRVAFQSRAPDLVDHDTNGLADIFLFDVATGSNQLVSAAFNGGSSGNNRSEFPILTADGRRVIFQSKATDLLAAPLSTGRYQVYARDLEENRTILVSRSPSSSGATAPGPVVVSARGNRVAFMGGNPSALYLCDLEADPDSTNLLVATRAVDPSLSADGRWIAYQQLPAAGAFGQVWVKDVLGSGAAFLASVNGTGAGGGNGHSASPTLDPSGRFVAFRSQASDLVGGDTNGWSDMFVRDLVNGATLLASVNRHGTSAGNRLSASPVLGWDPNVLLFHSYADDLVAGDLNQQGDLFLFRFEQGDADGDGLPDGWEWTYFGDLSRDGSQDFDDDGLTDREEYWAGTNPTNDASLLRVIAITALSTGDTQLIWSAAPSKQYRVQYLDALGGAWEDLSTPVTVNGQQGSAIDFSANLRLHRFYRVVALP